MDRPLRWKSHSAEVAALLEDLPANVLKGHGRRHAAHLLLAFDPARAAAARSAIHALASELTPARRQLAAAAEFKRADGAHDGGTLRCFFLTWAGYEALGAAAKAPAGQAFRQGLAAREHLALGVGGWERTYRRPIHALLLLADDDPHRLDRDRDSLLASLAAAGIALVGEERGLQQKNAAGRSVEHFGYEDGRSQPLFLAEDIEAERLLRGGTTRWDPAHPLNRVVVTRGAQALGSFAVFLKLEQNVQAFEQQRAAIARLLGRGARDLAGALMIGRFEDGTPATLRRQAGLGGEAHNDFDYEHDREGARCPLHAHVRKMNPRGQSGEPWERRHAIARRGITYGKRRRDLSDRPADGVGLLFLAYQARFEEQFEHLQAAWANNPAFPPQGGPPAPGVDPIIGTAARHGGHHWPVVWGDPTVARRPTPPPPRNARELVTPRGGLYLFAPTLSALRAL